MFGYGLVKFFGLLLIMSGMFFFKFGDVYLVNVNWFDGVGIGFEWIGCSFKFCKLSFLEKKFIGWLFLLWVVIVVLLFEFLDLKFFKLLVDEVEEEFGGW